MRIDSHVHILPPEFIKNIDKNMERDEHFKLLHSSPKAKFATAEDVLEEMKKAGIDKAVVFGFSCLDMGLAREFNDYVIEVVKRYPDRFIGFAVVPLNHKDTEKEIVRCVEKGLKGVGEIIPEAVRVDISKQDEIGKFASICRELNLPILMHVNELVGHYYPGKGKMGPEQAYSFALNNPDNVIIYAHWGGGLLFYELMPEVKETLKNVYYDTAASPYLYIPQIYRAVKIIGIEDKILFGSDFPLLSPLRYYKEWEKVDLEEQLKIKIEGENAYRIFFKT
ncbi:metal-dependent hydrolase [Caldanaerobacter subterraneus subsp. yonseiensis KB-1]|uniref:Metal-dependent hydrolase n=2 Tax=Caldanaerobacter subterraneus TaxID=911092 RepID=U5CTW5_CALSX|nr:amidohydrolase family protein [Caldanaerobacter subterraneus]ERM92356.1 metal-dependent hydrolase [Caldanaerobacter subterraneus subsp. yonseiensis KB-1]NNG66727.1 amidohydrolase [Caldanaerobacter subterraneus]